MSSKPHNARKTGKTVSCPSPQWIERIFLPSALAIFIS